MSVNEINFTTLRYHFNGEIRANKSMFCMQRTSVEKHQGRWRFRVYVFGCVCCFSQVGREVFTETRVIEGER